MPSALRHESWVKSIMQKNVRNPTFKHDQMILDKKKEGRKTCLLSWLLPRWAILKKNVLFFNLPSSQT